MQGAYSCCEATNPSVQMKELYGHQISGMFGAHCAGYALSKLYLSKDLFKA